MLTMSFQIGADSYRQIENKHKKLLSEMHCKLGSNNNTLKSKKTK